jgi:hypothetical protein
MKENTFWLLAVVITAGPGRADAHFAPVYVTEIPWQN